jgi:transcription initiation factor TFIID subunit 9B
MGTRRPGAERSKFCANPISTILTLAQFILSLATQTNATPLPPVPEVFGIRHPPEKDCLLAVDFDLVPNKPPPNVQLYEEEEYEETDDEVEEDEDEDEEMEEMDITGANAASVDGEANDDIDDADGLFGGEDDDAEDVSMGEPSSEGPSQVQRTLVEDDDYD